MTHAEKRKKSLDMAIDLILKNAEKKVYIDMYSALKNSGIYHPMGYVGSFNKSVFERHFNIKCSNGIWIPLNKENVKYRVEFLEWIKSTY